MTKIEDQEIGIDLDLDEDIKRDLDAVQAERQLPDVAVSLINRLLSNQEKMAAVLKPLMVREHDRDRDKKFYTKWGERAGYVLTAVFVAGVGAFFTYLFSTKGKGP